MTSVLLLFTELPKLVILHRSRRIRRRLSVAPPSNPAASGLQLSFGLSEKVGKGKLLGGGERLNTSDKSENSSGDDDRTLETSFGRSFGSGPNGLVDPISTHSVDFRSGFESEFTGVFDFFRFLIFLEGHERPLLRGLMLGLGIGRGRRGG